MIPGYPRGLLLSIALHAAALLALLFAREGPPANGITLAGEADALTVLLIAAASPETSPQASVPQAPPAAATAEEKTPLKLPIAESGTLQAASEKVVRKPVKRRRPPAERPGERPASSATERADVPQQGKDSASSEQGNAASTTRQKMVGSGDDERARYAARLRSEIETHKRYPPQASPASGEVTVRFTVEVDGSLREPQLVQSSGSRSLDRAALLAIQASRSVGPRPAGFGPSVKVTLRFWVRGR
ncbi:energy transducer TonB [Pluralibacter gergoviae]